MYIKNFLLFESHQKSEKRSLRSFEDEKATGTLGKNRSIYTNLYDYFMSKNDADKRKNVVGWLSFDSQRSNFYSVLKYIQEGDSILDYGCGVGDFLPFLEDYQEEFSYVGVDINDKFIEDAKKTYPEGRFYLIDKPEQIVSNFDVIVAIGVFTWYITKDDFIKTIRHLYSICNRSLVITCIHSSHVPESWVNTYRGYSESTILSLFPDLKIKFERNSSYLTIVFEK